MATWIVAWLANALTLSRIPLAIAFWIVAPHRPWAIAVIATAALTDALDGRAARWARRRSASPSDGPGPVVVSDRPGPVVVSDRPGPVVVSDRPGPVLTQSAFADAGAWLDPLCDKIFAITVLAALAVRLDVPIALLLLVAARELVMPPLLLVYAPLRENRDTLPAGKRATVAQFLAIIALVAEIPGASAIALVTGLLGVVAAAQYLERACRIARAP